MSGKRKPLTNLASESNQKETARLNSQTGRFFAYSYRVPFTLT